MSLDYFADVTTQTPCPFANTGRFVLADLIDPDPDPDDVMTVPIASRPRASTWECCCCGEDREGTVECGYCGDGSR